MPSFQTHMLVTHTERPRELKWYHAGPMLYGDWGTSRFYVLGLALFYALHASFYYVFAVGLLVAAVGWAYTIICRCYPDGGGVYSAARHTSKQLAVVGALLLFADYIVTASISAYDGIRYMGVPKETVPYVAMGAIFLVGVINYIGPRKAGTVALYIAIATLLFTLILTAFSIPHLAAGWSATHRPTESFPIQWTNFVAVVLALSGVEAIANMTGIMVPPVTKTANKAIWPVLVEVVILNIILAIAMNGLPAAGYDLGTAPGSAYKAVEDAKETHSDWQTSATASAEIQKTAEEQAKDTGADPKDLIARSTELKDHVDDTQDAVLRVMARVYVDPYIKFFSIIAGIVFGALLLSAVNTAVADMVSIQYVMSRDTELPHSLVRLNKFGVPWLALIAAVGLPVVLLNIFQDVYTLANLYAVGVVGAIAINLGSCSLNREMPVKKLERVGLAVLAVIMICIEATLVYQKPDARYFAGFVLASGLIARFFTKQYPKLALGQRITTLIGSSVFLILLAGVVYLFRDPIINAVAQSVALLNSAGKAWWFIIGFDVLLLAAACGTTFKAITLYRSPPKAAVAPVPAEAIALAPEPRAIREIGTPAEQLDMSKPKVLVATRGGMALINFAVKYAKRSDGVLMVMFVRQINIVGMAGPPTIRVEEDEQALDIFKKAAALCETAGVQMIPIYVVSPDVAYAILDHAATYNVEAVLMGVSREGALLKALRGDVLTAVADHLPSDIPLLIHA